MDQNNQGRDGYQKFIIFLVILLIGGSFGFSLGRKAERRGVAQGNANYGVGGAIKSAEKKEAPAGAAGQAASETMPVGGDAIAVSDQAPGSKVTISLVTLIKDGWVVIHADRDGKPGNILGAQRFNAGENQKGEVELLKPTEEGKVYYAMLHADDGDKMFDHTKDTPVADPQGNVIMMRFVASARPSGQ